MASKPQPTPAEMAAARIFSSHDGQVLLEALERVTIKNTGNFSTAPDAELRAHAGKCALYRDILTMIERGQGR